MKPIKPLTLHLCETVQYMKLAVIVVSFLQARARLAAGCDSRAKYLCDLSDTSRE